MKFDWNIAWRMLRSVLFVLMAEFAKRQDLQIVGAEPDTWWTPETTVSWLIQALAVLDALRTALPPLWAAFWVAVDEIRGRLPAPVPVPNPTPTPIPDPDHQPFFRAPANNRPALKPEDWD